MSRLIDAVWVEEKFKKALDTIAAHMADSAMSEDDENIKVCQNQYSAYSTALTILKHAPTIEAVPVVHGKWKPYKISNLFTNSCSVCNCDVNEKTPFCPYCGAKMGGADQ